MKSHALLVALLLLVTAAVGAVAPLDVGGPAWREEVSLADYRALAQLSGRVSRQQFEATLAFVDPGDLLAPYLEVTDAQVAVRLEPGDDDPIVVVGLAGEDQPPVPRPRRLGEMRILVDPGHFGGAWSVTENRHVLLDAREPLREGTLTWGVARLLIEDLEATGADVRSTRGPPPSEAFGANLDPRFDADHEVSLVLAERLGEPSVAPWVALYPSLVAGFGLRQKRRVILEAEGLWSFYSHYDLRRRSQMAADVEADVTVSLHFNIMGRRVDNWLVVFVPGNAMPGELESASQRFWAVRRTLDGQYPVILALGRAIMREMHASLRVPILRYETPEDAWPKKIPVDKALGVYARNLALLRRTPGPVVLVEGPPINHPREYEKLHRGGVDVDGVDYPPRVAAYARAVAAGLRVWAEADR